MYVSCVCMHTRVGVRGCVCVWYLEMTDTLYLDLQSFPYSVFHPSAEGSVCQYKPKPSLQAYPKSHVKTPLYMAFPIVTHLFHSTYFCFWWKVLSPQQLRPPWVYWVTSCVRMNFFSSNWYASKCHHTVSAHPVLTFAHMTPYTIMTWGCKTWGYLTLLE